MRIYSIQNNMNRIKLSPRQYSTFGKNNEKNTDKRNNNIFDTDFSKLLKLIVGFAFILFVIGIHDGRAHREFFKNPPPRL